MDFFKNISENLPLIIGAIALVAIQYFIKRRRGPEANHPALVQDLLAEVRLNSRIAEVFTFQIQAKRFITTTWKLNKNKLGFLGKALEANMSDAFTLAEDYNQQIAAAKKFKSTSYMASVNMDKLKVLLAACQEGLEQWLLSKVGSKDPPLRTPGVFDDLLGKR